MLADVILDGPYGIREPTLPLSVVRRPCVLPRECGPPSVRPSLCPSAITIHCLQAAAGGRRARVAETASRRHSYVAAAAVAAAHATSPCVLATSVAPCSACVHALFNGASHRLSSFRNSAHYWHRLSAPAIPSSDHPSIPPYHVAHDSPVAQAGGHGAYDAQFAGQRAKWHSLEDAAGAAARRRRCQARSQRSEVIVDDARARPRSDILR